MAPELGVWDSRADNCPEMVLRYCASSAEVNKFSLHQQTRKEERSPGKAAQVTLGGASFFLLQWWVVRLAGSRGRRRRRAAGVSSTGTAL